MASEPIDTHRHGSDKVPLHLWAVGVIALLWNAIGVTDYVMTRLHHDVYFRTVMPGVEPTTVYAYIDAMPMVAQAGWGLGVWGAAAGTLFLLARSRWAVWAYLASLVGAVVTFRIQYDGPKPPEGMDDGIMPVVITAIALALYLYARAMRARRVLS